ncbi:hypothetical protein V6N13_005531 [Hibiscus sabdariffa]
MDKGKVIAQYNVNAGLMDEFEQSEISGKSFNFSKSVLYALESVSDEQMTTYLSRIQRGGLVQSFSSRSILYALSCCVGTAIEEPSSVATFKSLVSEKNLFLVAIIMNRRLKKGLGAGGKPFLKLID